ncbi:6836_t:CDS:2 [Gigaspora rosea]|nr:6836_t:CDS:2 [Gigaspora rosea]
MSFTNTSKNFNFNVNTLKLTPEKLAEWCKRRASNTSPLSQAFRKESSSSQLSSLLDQNHHNNDDSQVPSNDSSSQPSTNNCTPNPHEMDVGAFALLITHNFIIYTFHVFALVLQHRLETIEASVEQIQESQLYINQDLDYLEKSLEYFEDELAVARVKARYC